MEKFRRTGLLFLRYHERDTAGGVGFDVVVEVVNKERVSVNYMISYLVFQLQKLWD